MVGCITDGYMKENNSQTFETNLKKALIGQNPNVESFAIFSGENPLGQSLNRELNKKCTQLLRRSFRSERRINHPINGKFNGTKEHSYIVYNIPFNVAKGYAEDFEQLSFIYAKKVENGRETPYMNYEYWERTLEDKTYRKTMKANSVTNAKDFTDMFSRLNDYKFQIDLENIEDMPKDIQEKLTKHLTDEQHKILKEYTNGKIVGLYFAKQIVEMFGDKWEWSLKKD